MKSEREMQNEFFESYDVHSPISITDNDDLNATAIAEGWPGYGNSTHPFRIEGWNITGTGSLIQISTVTLHFVISNCYLNNTGSSPGDYGVYISSSANGTIEDTETHGGYHGLFIGLCEDVYVDNTQVSDASNHGIYIPNSENVTLFECDSFTSTTGLLSHTTDNLTLEGNSFYSNSFGGISAYYSDFSTFLENTVYSNEGTGILLYDSHNSSFLSNTIYNNSQSSPETGIHAEQSDNGTIFDNEIYDNVWAGIEIKMGNNWHLEANQIYNNSDYGITGSGENITIVSNNITQNGWWEGGGPLRAGISFGEASHWTIEGNDIYNNTPAGICVIDADYSSIADNNVSDNTEYGICGDWADNITVSGNDIWRNGWNTSSTSRSGINVTGTCDDWNIVGNSIWNNSKDGIRMSGANCEISNNIIAESKENGIKVWQTTVVLVQDNTVFANQYGIDLGASFSNITDNLVYDNTDMGVVLSGCTNVMVWANDIGWNGWNGIGIGLGPDVYWYNNYTDEGNHWSDYSGTGSYTTPGGEGDLYPSKSLDLNHSTYPTFELGSTGNTVTCPAYALNPWKYEVFLYGNPYKDDIW
ncbi:MAG: right-handed parallel beta-helix repeat-containing protein, partial [Candidatus Thorarchaeota archaeon]